MFAGSGASFEEYLFYCSTVYWVILAINSFSLKLQVANLVLHCSPSTSIKVCTMENAKLAKIKRRNRLIFGKCLSY